MGAVKRMFDDLRERSMTPKDVEYLKQMEDYYHKHLMKTKMFEKGKSYTIAKIIQICIEHDIPTNEEGSYFTEHGHDSLIGESFLTVSNDDKSHSFVLTGYSAAHGGIFECIYTD